MTPKRADQSIVLYEDDVPLAREIVAAFSEEGREVTHVIEESVLEAAVRSETTSVLIMDRMVYGRDSLEFIKDLRTAGKRVPVVVISALVSVDERIRGLEAGGDDYLVKPFIMGELLARVEALLRRSSEGRSIRITAGPLVMDLVARAVSRDARVLDLLPKEFSLLEYFMRHANQVVTRTMLLEHVWNYKLTAHTNVVDVHVSNLRRKVDADEELPLISSVRGLGFKLTV